MGKIKKGITESAPQSNKHLESLVEEQPKKKKLRTGTSVDCSVFKDPTASKLITKIISHVVEDKLTEEEKRVFERKLKKERKKEQRTVNLECAVGIKNVEPEFLVEGEPTAEERRTLNKEREREERKLKKKHPTDLKEAEPEFSLEQELTEEERRVVERKLKKERKKEEKKSKKECLAKNKEAKSELSLEEELTAEERRVFERKLKKERKKEQRKLKQECPTDLKEAVPQKPSGCELALQYLTSWSHKTEDWKFQKTRQTWLLLHMYDPEKVPGSHFLILLDYLEGLRGTARDLTVRKAEALMKEHENANTEDHTLLELMERARQVIQLLS